MLTEPSDWRVSWLFTRHSRDRCLTRMSTSSCGVYTMTSTSSCFPQQPVHQWTRDVTHSQLHTFCYRTPGLSSACRTQSIKQSKTINWHNRLFTVWRRPPVSDQHMTTSDGSKSKWVRLAPNGDFLKIRFQYSLYRRSLIYSNMIWKSPGIFFSLGTNLTQHEKTGHTWNQLETIAWDRGGWRNLVGCLCPWERWKGLSHT